QPRGRRAEAKHSSLATPDDVVSRHEEPSLADRRGAEPQRQPLSTGPNLVVYGEGEWWLSAPVRRHSGRRFCGLQWRSVAGNLSLSCVRRDGGPIVSEFNRRPDATRRR